MGKTTAGTHLARIQKYSLAAKALSAIPPQAKGTHDRTTAKLHTQKGSPETHISPLIPLICFAQVNGDLHGYVKTHRDSQWVRKRLIKTFPHKTIARDFAVSVEPLTDDQERTLLYQVRSNDLSIHRFNDCTPIGG